MQDAAVSSAGVIGRNCFFLDDADGGPGFRMPDLARQSEPHDAGADDQVVRRYRPFFQGGSPCNPFKRPVSSGTPAILTFRYRSSNLSDLIPAIHQFLKTEEPLAKL